MWRRNRRRRRSGSATTSAQRRSDDAVAISQASVATLDVQLTAVAAVADRRTSSSRRHEKRSSCVLSRRRRRSHLDLVAQEIETVIYGESDDDDNDDEGDGGYYSVGGGVGRNNPGSIELPARRSGSIGRRPLGGQSFGPSGQVSTSRRSSHRYPPARERTADLAVDINSYTLFDMLRDGEDRTTTSPSASASEQQHQSRHPSIKKRGPSIIYGQKYQSAGSLLLPVMAFLAAIFVLLLVIRILVGLFTAAVGMLVLSLCLLRILQDFVSRPIRFLRTLHSSPILFLASLGAIVGVLDALWKQQLPPLLVDGQTFVATVMRCISAPSRWLEWGRTCTDATDIADAPYIADTATHSASRSTNNSTSSSYGDILLLWGLLRGLFIGVEIGSIWLVLLGHSAEPSFLTTYLHRCVWRPLRRRYRTAAIVRRQQYARLAATVASTRYGCSRRSIDHHHGGEGDSATMAALAPSLADGDDRRLCAICLECFPDSDRDRLKQHGPPSATVTVSHQATDATSIRSGGDRYQLLPCLHCFHRDCARTWLTVRRSCPICRVEVGGMQGCTAGSAVERTVEK